MPRCLLYSWLVNWAINVCVDMPSGTWPSADSWAVVPKAMMVPRGRAFQSPLILGGASVLCTIQPAWVWPWKNWNGKSESVGATISQRDKRKTRTLAEARELPFLHTSSTGKGTTNPCKQLGRSTAKGLCCQNMLPLCFSSARTNFGTQVKLTWHGYTETGIS